MRMLLLALALVSAATLACGGSVVDAVAGPSMGDLAELELHVAHKHEEMRRLYRAHLQKPGDEPCVPLLRELEPKEDALDRALIRAIADKDRREWYDVLNERLALYDEMIAVLQDCTGRVIVP